MNKKLLITAGAIVLVVIFGIGAFQSSADMVEPALERETIKEQVIADYPGTITEFELDRENGRTVYEVEISGDGIEYDLKVDADTGEILKVEEERKGTKQTTKENVAKPTTTEAKAERISLEEAKAIALEQFEGTVKEIELDEDDGRYIYEIEMKNGHDEAEFDIDAVTGEIIEFEIDRD